MGRGQVVGPWPTGQQAAGQAGQCAYTLTCTNTAAAGCENNATWCKNGPLPCRMV